jgi:hypothetical protein
MNKLIRLRRSAFENQQGRCFYCKFRMWLNDPGEAFGNAKAPAKVARKLRCTAEHLRPVSEGGKDEPSNVVAACWFCNSTRHRAKKALPPERYVQRVQRRVASRRWHDAAIWRALSHG